MDRQYEHIFIGDSDYYGFLPDYPDERIDSMAEKGITSLQGK